MTTKYLKDFYTESCKRAIENKILEDILKFYHIKIEEAEIPDEDKKFYLNQKKYRIIYRPKAHILELRTYINDFIMELQRGGERQLLNSIEKA